MIENSAGLIKEKFEFKGGAQENYLHKDKFLQKMGHFAILLPVSSHIVTLELFPTKI
jgi:hypothetical protein